MYTAVYMLAADAAVAAAVFGLEDLISYCNHTKRCFGPTSRSRHSRGERESLHSPQLDRERDAARQRAAATCRRETDEARATHTHSNVRVTTKALACNCWGTDSDTSSPCADEPRRCLAYCCTAVTASGIFVGRVLDSSQRYLLLL